MATRCKSLKDLKKPIKPSRSDCLASWKKYEKAVETYEKQAQAVKAEEKERQKLIRKFAKRKIG